MKTIDLNQALELCKQGEGLYIKEREKLQKERLTELVLYAKAHSPYFREAYRHINEDFSLTQLPATNKETLMKDYGKWVTDPRITYKGVHDYIDSPQSGTDLYLDQYTAITTSGTTGEPMPMVRDAYHNTIHGALTQSRLLRETDPAIMTPVGHKLAVIIFTDPHVSSYSSFLRMKKKFPGYEHNLLEVSVTESLQSITAKLEAFQPDMITGYPSVMGAIAGSQLSGDMNIHPQAIACSAEVLTPKVYHALKEAFHCPVLNNYCSTEGGEAAMSCSCGNLHINEDWIIIEPVDENGAPSEPGSWSEGIYITDLTNYVQPIIRYYMNDKIKIHREPCKCGSNLPVMEIMGRSSENITLSGATVLGVNIEYALMYVEGAYALQVVQKAQSKIEIRMIAESHADPQEIFLQAKSILTDFFPKQGCGHVEIISSNQPPIHSERGGKVKFIVKDFE